MFLNIRDPIIGLIQKMKNGAEYIILDSAFHNQRDELVCTVKIIDNDNELPYRFDRILADSKRFQRKANLLEL